MPKIGTEQSHDWVANSNEEYVLKLKTLNKHASICATYTFAFDYVCLELTTLDRMRTIERARNKLRQITGRHY